MADNPAVALAYSIAEKQTELFRRVRRNAAARAAGRDVDIAVVREPTLPSDGPRTQRVRPSEGT